MTKRAKKKGDLWLLKVLIELIIAALLVIFILRIGSELFNSMFGNEDKAVKKSFQTLSELTDMVLQSTNQVEFKSMSYFLPNGYYLILYPNTDEEINSFYSGQTPPFFLRPKSCYKENVPLPCLCIYNNNPEKNQQEKDRNKNLVTNCKILNEYNGKKLNAVIGTSSFMVGGFNKDTFFDVFVVKKEESNIIKFSIYGTGFSSENWKNYHICKDNSIPCGAKGGPEILGTTELQGLMAGYCMGSGCGDQTVCLFMQKGITSTKETDGSFKLEFDLSSLSTSSLEGSCTDKALYQDGDKFFETIIANTVPCGMLQDAPGGSAKIIGSGCVDNKKKCYIIYSADESLSKLSYTGLCNPVIP